MIIHPDYEPGSDYNNIALLFVSSSEPFTDAPHIKPLCLPPKNLNLDRYYSRKRCIVAGWGATTQNTSVYLPLIPKKIELSLVQKPACECKYRTLGLRHNYTLHNSILCAGGLNEDACNKDGGAPLICQISGTTSYYHQVGIVFFGLSCGQTDTPGLYTTVDIFRDWIDKELLDRNIVKDSYIYTEQ